MAPAPFAEQTMVLGVDQPEYLPLPAYRASDGSVISCWRLTWRDRLRLLWTGRIWAMQLTYGKYLQPLLLQTDHPFRDQTAQAE
jgi:hypothetical protein